MIIKHTLILAIPLFITLTVHADDEIASAPRTGAYTVSMPAKELLAYADNIDEHAIGADESVFWEIYVPVDYQATTPPGVVVYVSPGQSGKYPAGWDKVMNEQNLIWISAYDSGNQVPANQRILKALFALSIVQKMYAIDEQRVYIAGFSGGGKIASMVAGAYANVFKGAVFICGVSPWNPNPPALLNEIRTNHYVFLTGRRDFNLEPTRRVQGAYKKAGVVNSKLMVVNNMGHELPRSSSFANAIAYLDGRLAKSETRPATPTGTSNERD